VVLPDKRILAERVIIAENEKIPWNVSIGTQTIRKTNNAFMDDLESLSIITERRLGLSLRNIKDKVDIHHIATHRPQRNIGFLHQHALLMDIYRIRLLSSVTLRISETCEIKAFDFDSLVESSDNELKCDPRSKEVIDLFVGLKINP